MEHELSPLMNDERKSEIIRKSKHNRNLAIFIIIFFALIIIAIISILTIRTVECIKDKTYYTNQTFNGEVSSEEITIEIETSGSIVLETKPKSTDLHYSFFTSVFSSVERRLKRVEYILSKDADTLSFNKQQQQHGAPKQLTQMIGLIVKDDWWNCPRVDVKMDIDPVIAQSGRLQSLNLVNREKGDIFWGSLSPQVEGTTKINGPALLSSKEGHLVVEKIFSSGKISAQTDKGNIVASQLSSSREICMSSKSSGEIVAIQISAPSIHLRTREGRIDGTFFLSAVDRRLPQTEDLEDQSTEQKKYQKNDQGVIGLPVYKNNNEECSMTVTSEGGDISIDTLQFLSLNSLNCTIDIQTKNGYIWINLVNFSGEIVSESADGYSDFHGNKVEGKARFVVSGENNHYLNIKTQRGNIFIY